MIETWFLVFLIVFLRNKFVQNLEKNNIYLYRQYNLKNIFKHWSIIPPLIMLIVYIIFEAMVFMDYRQIIEYGTVFKQITLLSYLALIVKYELYDSAFGECQKSEIKSFITSPFFFAVVCLSIGYLLNYAAISANGGHMPVFPDLTIATGYTDIDEFTDNSFYILGGFDSKMIPFCDILDIGFSNLSIGDVFVRMYAFIILYFSIKKSNKL